MGVGVSNWVLAKAVSLRGPARRGLGHLRGHRAGAPAAGRRHGRPHPPGHGALPPPRGGGRRAAEVLPPRGTRRGRAVQAHPHVPPGGEQGARPAHHARQLRGGVAGQGGARRGGGDEPAHQGADAQPGHALRRHAGARGLRADGRRHPQGDPGRARPLRRARARLAQVRGGGHRPRRRGPAHLRPARALRGAAGGDQATVLPPHHRLELAGHHAGAQGVGAGGRVRDRGAHRGRAQRAAAGGRGLQRARRAAVRRARRGGPGEDEGARAPLLAGRGARGRRRSWPRRWTRAPPGCRWGRSSPTPTRAGSRRR